MQILRTSEWDLGGSEALVFTNMSAGCDPRYPGSFFSCQHLWVDDIVVLDLTPPYVKEWAFKTATVMQLTLNEPYDPVTVRSPSLFSLSSVDDPNYSVAVHAADVGIETKFTAFSQVGSAVCVW
jgi:hypothetical protein